MAQNVAEKVARHLLEIEAVVLQPSNPFTWSSGMKAPIYCDNRLTMAYPKVRQIIADAFVENIKHYYPEVEVIAGTSTAGIPHAAWVSDKLDLPMAYVRGSVKDHGKKKQIEGVVKEGQKVVVIEDLISTGGSAFTTVKALRDAGADVLGVVAIFTYNLEKAEIGIKERAIDAHTLTDFHTLSEVASQNGYLDSNQLKQLSKWQHDPDHDGWMAPEEKIGK